MEEISDVKGSPSSAWSSSKHISSLLKRPALQRYESIPVPEVKKPSESEDVWDTKEEPMPGFSEFRKYKRINETRVITPYQPEIPEQALKKEEDRTPEIKVSDPRRFIFEEIGFISVESLESLIRMINSYPDLGYVNMSRNHMDLVRDYRPYQYTICNYKDVNKLNYVTISRNGLVEFYKGDADFLPLERLTIEYELYNSLRQIPSFRTFCMWKAFMVWFKKIRRRKYTEAREKIEAFYIAKYGS